MITLLIAQINLNTDVEAVKNIEKLNTSNKDIKSKKLTDHLHRDNELDKTSGKDNNEVQ